MIKTVNLCHWFVLEIKSTNRYKALGIGYAYKNHHSAILCVLLLVVVLVA